MLLNYLLLLSTQADGGVHMCMNALYLLCPVDSAANVTKLKGFILPACIKAKGDMDKSL